jgi:hypothetical protein
LQDVFEGTANDFLEDVVLLLVIEKLSSLEHTASARTAVGQVMDHGRNHFFCIRVRKWVEQNVLDDTEDRGCGADTEGERDSSQTREGRLPAHPSNGVR